jgi:putative hydrolase of the HAD superfamily
VIRALLLDLDGTLLDDSTVETGVLAACVALAEHAGIASERLLAANDAIWPGLWAEVGDPWMRGRMTGREVAHESWRRTLREVGLDDGELIELAVQTHESLDVEGLRLYDDVLDTVALARTRGLKLAIVTNGASDTQRTKLLEMELEPLVDLIAISGELGHVKPEVGIFDFVLVELGVDAASAVMVGDSLENDVAGARAAGITSVWINRTAAPRPTGAQPDYTISSLAELPGLLQQLAL